jgi:hypothetical protein
VNPSQLKPGDRIKWSPPEGESEGADPPSEGIVTRKHGSFAVAIVWDDGASCAIPIDSTAWWQQVESVRPTA